MEGACSKEANLAAEAPSDALRASTFPASRGRKYHHSALMPAALMIGHHFSCVARQRPKQVMRRNARSIAAGVESWFIFSEAIRDFRDS